MAQLIGKAKRVRIYLCQTDRVHRNSLYDAVVQRAKELDLAGVSVFRGLEGYGASCRIHEAKPFGFFCDSPILIEIVDCEEYIARLLSELDKLVSEGLVTVDDVDAVMYGDRRRRTGRSVEA